MFVARFRFSRDVPGDNIFVDISFESKPNETKPILYIYVSFFYVGVEGATVSGLDAERKEPTAQVVQPTQVENLPTYLWGMLTVLEMAAKMGTKGCR